MKLFTANGVDGINCIDEDEMRKGTDTVRAMDVPDFLKTLDPEESLYFWATEREIGAIENAGYKVNR